jgi:hypothetical protein
MRGRHGQFPDLRRNGPAGADHVLVQVLIRARPECETAAGQHPVVAACCAITAG